MNKNLLIFDGDCLFCNKIAYFLAKSDKSNKVFFVASTSKIGQEIITENNLQLLVNQSLIFKEDTHFYIKSKAISHFLRQTNLFPFLRLLLRVIPTFITDFCYDIIAKNRKKIPLKCAIPSPEIQQKIL